MCADLTSLLNDPDTELSARNLAQLLDSDRGSEARRADDRWGCVLCELDCQNDVALLSTKREAAEGEGGVVTSHTHTHVVVDKSNFGRKRNLTTSHPQKRVGHVICQSSLVVTAVFV